MLDAGAVGLLVAAVGIYVTGRVGNTWDFTTYYYAALAVLHGLDPYRLDVLSVLAGRTIEIPFLYPPATLPLFVPLARLPIAHAVVAWLVFKLALVVVLLALWRTVFLRETRVAVLAGAAFLGFNASLLWDLRAGNVAVIEQLLLWAGFVAYVRDRRTAFTVCVVLASIFKLLPILFLGLLLVPSKRSPARPGLALGGLATWAAIVFLPGVLGLGVARGFLHDIPSQRPHGEINPCALGLFDMILARDGSGAAGRSRLAIGLWLGYGAILAWLSRGMLRRAWAARDPIHGVVVGCLLFTLLVPRMMVYSYILLVVPALLLIRALLPDARARAVAYIVLAIQGAARFLPGTIRSPVVDHLPFLLALVLWFGLWRAREPLRWATA